MRFQIKEKLFSIGDNFTIDDENGEPQYKVKGKIISLGNKLTMMDMEDNELYYIEQKLMKLFAEYDLSKDGQVVAKCKKKFSILKSKFEITSDKGDFVIEGSPLNYSYQILKEGNVVAQVDKKFFSFSDTYGVDVSDSEDFPFILSLVVIIDQVFHDNKK